MHRVSIESSANSVNRESIPYRDELGLQTTSKRGYLLDIFAKGV